LFKIILPFYIICFALYVFFSRRPDYTDGEITKGIIHYITNPSTNKPEAKAIFVSDKFDTVSVGYPLRNYKEGDTVKIIYETAEPSKAAVYSWWGYWFKWDELLASVVLCFILSYAAKAITSRPTPQALIEEMEMLNPPKRKKYD